MQLHHLQPNNRNRKAKRIGRGGKRGSYSGRGVKGQKSRAGRRIRPAERELIQRLPKLRGYKNKPKSEKPLAINVGDLMKHTKNGAVSAEMFERRVKILGDGELKEAVTVRGLSVSESAKKKIEKAGGTIEAEKR